MGLVDSGLVTELQSPGSYTDNSPNAITEGKPRFKVGYLLGGATADATDTFTVDIYKQWGMTRFLGFKSYRHTTADSHVIPEAITTTMDNTTLVITLPSGANNKKRLNVIYGI